ncbi:hypothetical protein DMI62_10855 [Escherichia coli]|nr:hypothetical protein [Escherichia coli]
MDEQGWLMPDITLHFHVEPFVGANCNQGPCLQAALIKTIPIAARSRRVRGAARNFLKLYVKVLKRAVVTAPLLMVAHNANFDHSFTWPPQNAPHWKRNPFHPFATLDTAALAGLALGQTVLSKACQTAGMDFDSTQALRAA